MRVLMLNNEYPPLGGGTGSVNANLVQHLAKLPDIQIDIVTSSLTRSTYETEQLLPNVRMFKVPVDNRCLHHSSNRELLTYAWRAFWFALKLARQGPYDACVAFCTVPAGAVALALRFLLGLPYIVRLSGPDIPGFEQRYDLVTRLLTPFIRLAWARAERVIAKCAHEADMARRVLPNARIMMIPNAVDLQWFQPAAPSANGHSSPVNLLCVARLIERKGQHHLLQAGRLLRDRACGPFRIVLVGQGDAESNLKAQAAALGLEDCVEFRGYVAREHMPEEYARADVFVLPSYNEGMSVATLEAMGAQLPLVVTRDSGLEELVDGNGFTFARGDVPALAAALGDLIADEQARRQMGRQSRLIARRYDWEQVSATYYDLLGDAATRRRSG